MALALRQLNPIYKKGHKVFVLVVAVFKRESRLFCNNQRPILLLSNIRKLTEKMVHQWHYQLLDQQKCFYNLQFGFGFNISADNALILIIENIQSSLDLGK